MRHTRSSQRTRLGRLGRLTVAVAAGLALLLGAACSSDAAPSPTPTATIDPAGGGISPATPDEPPAGTFEVGGTEHALGLGSYCWSPPTGSGRPALCADAIGYITPPDPVTVAPGATIEITGGLAMAPIEITSVRLWTAPSEPVASGDGFTAWQPDGEGERLAVVDGLSITLPDGLEAGDYLLTVDIMSIDPSSSATYSVILTVE
ncbi:MAG: hypothetical protein O2798_09960 [Chloroflexi bacterium]|nr:hypothetical protein [Chloroflexota bacterium]MDA1241149.1 hypothetical protein [Chloroflexota bacterium]